MYVKAIETSVDLIYILVLTWPSIVTVLSTTMYCSAIWRMIFFTFLFLSVDHQRMVYGVRSQRMGGSHHRGQRWRPASQSASQPASQPTGRRTGWPSWWAARSVVLAMSLSPLAHSGQNVSINKTCNGRIHLQRFRLAKATLIYYGTHGYAAHLGQMFIDYESILSPRLAPGGRRGQTRYVQTNKQTHTETHTHVQGQCGRCTTTVFAKFRSS